ncbi:MAG: glycerate kinase [Desulfurococcus sp.]
MSRIINFEEVSVKPWFSLLATIMNKVLEYADPYNAVRRHVIREGNILIIGDKRVEVNGELHVVGFGKASKRMLEAVLSELGDLVVGGVVITPDMEGRLGPVELLKGNHPIPGNDTLKSSRKLLEYLTSKISSNDVLIVLISGGGSALFEIPEEGVELKDIESITKELMKRGANIVELNTVRKRLSKVKGGKLLRYIKAQHTISLIISDVVGDKLEFIASGPTAPDSSTWIEAYRILVKYGLWDELEPRIKSIFEKGLKGEITDTLKKDDPIFSKVLNFVVLNNKMVLENIASDLREWGYKTLILTPFLEGEAKEVAKVLAAVAKSIRLLSQPVRPPAAIIAGGETVVTVKGSGVGGRNQELCLSFAIAIAGEKGISAACMGTDGIDGISPAAGALVDWETVSEAIQHGLDPVKSLKNNDSFTFFNKLRKTLVTGYTGTNVNDIFISLIDAYK